MTKEQERAELHRVIWQIANDLRGSVDGWDFKSYVLGILFYRYISENITSFVNEEQHKAGEADFDYKTISDDDALLGKEQIVINKGFFILPSELFCNVRKNAKNDDDLNQTLSTVFKNIELSSQGTASEEDFKGLFADVDVNSNKLGASVPQRNAKLVKILDAIGDLKLGNFTDNTIDAFGDAYEYLMTMYASNAGKSGGEFFTPQEVSTLLTKLTLVDTSKKGNFKTEVNKVYDPCAGSGSLLLKFAKVLGADKVRQGFYGQEINITTYNLCRINMFLHNINYEKFDIACGDTLTSPQHWDDEPFEAIVSNPPYGIKWEGDDNTLLISDERFAPAGVLAPKSKADLAFTMHMLHWLSTTGTAAIVEFPGVLYRGGKEQKIRQYLIDNNFVDCVIQLPSNMFFGTPIATCIIVLKKSKKDNGVLFIDATNEFIHSGNKNKLTDENIEKILNAYIERTDKDHFSKLVSNEEIGKNDYNISVSSYVEQEDTREVIDIKELNASLIEIVAKQNDLRAKIDVIVADLEGVAKMSKVELLITLVKEAVDKCYTNDRTLIERNMEQASVARIFYYMQRKIDTNNKFKQLREYNLDCEYNKNMNDPKRLAENERGKRLDVILHGRMSNNDNLLILEFKNGINNLHQDNLINDDYDKLREFTNSDGIYKYFLGISVKLNVEEPMYVFFQNGQETAREDLLDE